MADLVELNNAVRTGNITEVKRLLNHELKGKDVINTVSDPGGQGTGGMSPLMVACQLSQNYQEMVQVLLRRGANVNLQNQYGWTALMKAVNDERVEVVMFLLKLVNIEFGLELRNSDSATVLMIACKQGNLHMVNLLLAKGSQVNVAGKHYEKSASRDFDQYRGKTPLMIAIANKHVEVVKLLLDKGATVVFEDKDALNMACQNNDTVAVKLLLGSKAVQINSMVTGTTPLIEACRYNSYEIVELLLQQGAKVGLQDNSGESALTVSMHNCSVEMVRLLLRYCSKDGDEINMKTKRYNDTALMIAIRSEADVSIVNLLLENGADVNVESVERETALTIALNKYRDYTAMYDVVKLLFEKGAVFNYKTFLYLSPTKNSIEVCKLLLSQGIDFGKMLKRRMSSLSIFVQADLLELVKFCVNNEIVDVNKLDKDGEYPIWHAVQRKNYDIFEFLFMKNANLNMHPNNEKSALEMLKADQSLLNSFLQHALRNQNYSIAEFLLINGAEAMGNTFESTPEMIDLQKFPFVTQWFLTSQASVIEKMIEENEEDVVPPAGGGDEQAMEVEICGSTGNLESELMITSERKRKKSGSFVDPVPIKQSRNYSVEENYLVEKIAEALSKNEKISRKHAHSVLIGPTGSGKSSFLDRLIHRKRKEFYTSTGIAEKVAVIELKTNSRSTFCAVDVLDSNTWHEVEFEKSFIGQMQENLRSHHQTSDSSMQHENDLLVSSSLPKFDETETVVMPEASDLMTEEVVYQLSSAPALDLQLFIRDVLQDSWGYMEFDDLSKKISLYFRDAGGQVEFQEMISLLIFGPSIFFYVFRADLDFKSKFEVEYRKGNGESINCYTSSITNEEALLQSLASVAAMDTEIKNDIETHKPQVFIVATHKDQLGLLANTKLAELNEHLNLLLESFNFQSIVQYADIEKREVLFAVNNLSESDEDFKLIRRKMYDLINDNKEFSIDYPISYLLFCLDLQRDQQSFLTFEECEAIAAMFGIAGEEVPRLLKFLHLRTGVIQYIEIDGMKPLVLKEPQILFEMVTDFIIGSFSSKKKTSKQTIDIRERGILPKSAFEKIASSCDAITSEEFLKILINLRMISRLLPSTDSEERYFIPCILNHVPEAAIKDVDPAFLPLILKFKCEYCPKGLFGVLIAHLLNPVTEVIGPSSNLSFQLLEDKIFKDQVSFEIHSQSIQQDELSLKLCLSYLEVNFWPDNSIERDTSMVAVCNQVRQRIERAVDSSLKNLHYSISDVKPEMCLKCEQCQEPHVVKDTSRGHMFFCKKFRQTCSIPLQGKVWFEQADSGLKGVNVFNETTVQVTSASQTFDWEEYGLKLVISSQSLPAHVKSCTITIKVSLCGQYEFPDDTELVSPVFWLSCEPLCHFTHALSLEIEHCALPENSNLLCVVRADSKLKQLPHSFSVIPGGIFSDHSCAIISLNGSSGIGIAQKHSKQRHYFSNIFYTGPLSNRVFYFAVTWHDKSHVKVIRDYFDSIGAKSENLGHSLYLQDEKISLDIPKDGILTDGWKLCPKRPPIISKKDIDSHRPQSVTVPHCALNVMWMESGQVKPLHCVVDILGATEESYITICIYPAAATGRDGDNSQLSSDSLGMVYLGRSEPKSRDLAFIKSKDGTIYRLYQSTAKHYKTIANTLGLERSEIVKIEENKQILVDRVEEVFQVWLQNANQLPNGYGLNWTGLQGILKDSDLANVAEKFFDVLNKC